MDDVVRSGRSGSVRRGLRTGGEAARTTGEATEATEAANAADTGSAAHAANVRAA